ncbi:MAG: TRAP transporter large permease [Casimicrobiaceae bacterium]|nr:TRAP transporter large permease [Pseudomonadota bacterium]
MPALATAITVLLVLLLAIGMPIAFAIAVAGTVGVYLIGGLDMVLSFLTTVPFSGAANYELMTIPMFVLMAEFVIVSGVADDLFDTVNAWVQKYRGGLGISTILTGAAFGAICGSSAASAATLSATALPQMVRHGYDRRAASGLTAIVGTLAVMIPPSNGLVIYGILSEVNIGKLLVAGLFPGLLGAAVLILALRFLLWRNPNLIKVVPQEVEGAGDRVRMLVNIAPMLVLFALVTGVLYLGVATPTEASALGAFGALVLALAKRRLSLAAFYRALRNTARTSAMITMIIIGALLFGYFLTLTQTTQSIVHHIGGLPVPRGVILALVILIYLVLGCFLDQVAILVLTVPITLPIIVGLGYDPLWFGIIVTLTSEIGLVTPPVGLNVFIVARYTETPLQDVFAGVAPYVVAMLLLLIALAAFPQLVLWVPSTIPN